MSRPLNQPDAAGRQGIGRPVRELTCIIPAYWPVMGNAQLLLGELARASQSEAGGRAGSMRLRILTSSGLPEWSSRFQLDGCEVIRLDVGNSWSWRRRDFEHAVVKRLRSEAELRGVVLLLDCPGLVPAIREALPEGVGLAARMECPTWGGLAAGDQFLRRGLRSLQNADLILATCRSQLRAIVQTGILPAGRSGCLPDCVEIPDGQLKGSDPLAASARRGVARQSLGELHPALVVGQEDELVVCVWPGPDDAAARLLLKTWRLVLRQGEKETRGPRLWIVGEGPALRGLMDQVQRLGWTESVTFPGAFDSLEECLAAANVVLHPAPSDVAAMGLLLGLREGTACVSLPETEGEAVANGADPAVPVSGSEAEFLATRLLEHFSRGREAPVASLSARDFLSTRNAGAILDWLVEPESWPQAPWQRTATAT
jgi:Glycosyl transferases group 1